MIEQNLGSNTKISLICRVVHMELNCELNKMPCLKISQETLYYKQQNKNSKNFMMSLGIKYQLFNFVQVSCQKRISKIKTERISKIKTVVV